MVVMFVLGGTGLLVNLKIRNRWFYFLINLFVCVLNIIFIPWILIYILFLHILETHLLTF